jgi:hypothetical protein
MRLPRYWVRTEGTATAPDGRPFKLNLWGWSQESESDARAAAERRRADLAARIARGETLHAYAYGERALREERVRVLGDDRDPAAVVTRNRHGALVLNASRVPFIDIDAPESPRPASLFSVFGPKKPAADTLLDGIRQSCARHALQSFRVYRTKAGYRVLVTDMTLEPASEAARSLLQSFGADPAFVTLCRVQESFRARLTPKPWRCGCPSPPVGFPRPDAASQSAFADWLRQYESRSQSFATCQFVESIGMGRQSDEARAIVIEHDRTTKAESGLPLA